MSPICPYKMSGFGALQTVLATNVSTSWLVLLQCQTVLVSHVSTNVQVWVFFPRFVLSYLLRYDQQASCSQTIQLSLVKPCMVMITDNNKRQHLHCYTSALYKLQSRPSNDWISTAPRSPLLHSPWPSTLLLIHYRTLFTTTFYLVLLIRIPALLYFLI